MEITKELMDDLIEIHEDFKEEDTPLAVLIARKYAKLKKVADDLAEQVKTAKEYYEWVEKEEEDAFEMELTLANQALEAYRQMEAK